MIIPQPQKIEFKEGNFILNENTNETVYKPFKCNKMKNTAAYLLLTCFFILFGCCSTENKISQQNQVKDPFSESLPSRNAEYVLPRLAKFTPQQRLTNIQDILGKPDGDSGSAIHDLWYTLDDNSTV